MTKAALGTAARRPGGPPERAATLRPPGILAPPTSPRELLARLAPELRRRPFLVVSDFDGTLAPLGLDPWGAAIASRARRALRRLSGTVGVAVAFLSGRTVADLAARVRVGGARYVGNDGLESGSLARSGRPDRIRVRRVAGFETFVARADVLADAVAAAISEPWLVVERKGPAVTFHYRGAPDVPAAGGLVRATVDKLDGAADFVRHEGARMLELRPLSATTKADAVLRLLAEVRPGLALVLGDGGTDAAAFVALRTAAGGSAERLVAVSVAVRSHGAPLPAVEQAADSVLASTEAVADLLGRLARTLAA
ncbi:MAG: trehalose-phosphatase [Candidatus Limnocylindrales bacterium]